MTLKSKWDEDVISMGAEVRNVAIGKMSDSHLLILDGIRDCVESDGEGLEAWELIGRLYYLGMECTDEAPVPQL